MAEQEESGGGGNSAFKVKGEITNQSVSVKPTTGAKWFGTSLAASSSNPNIVGKYDTLYIVAGLSIVFVSYLFFKGRE